VQLDNLVVPVLLVHRELPVLKVQLENLEVLVRLVYQGRAVRRERLERLGPQAEQVVQVPVELQVLRALQV